MNCLLSALLALICSFADSPYPYYLHGRHEFEATDYEMAAILFRKAIPNKNYEKAPWVPDTLYHLALCKFNTDPIALEKVCNQIVEVIESNHLEKEEDFRLLLAKCYLKINKGEKCIEQTQLLIQNSKHVDAACLLQINALLLSPTQDSVFRAQALLKQIHTSSCELAFLETFCDAFLNPLRKRELWNLFLCENKVEPWNSSGKMHLAEISYQERNYKEAESLYAEVLKTSYFNAESLYKIALCLEKQQKPFQDIQKAYSKVYESFPNSLFAAESFYKQLPALSYALGKKEAIEHLKALTSRFPQTPHAMYAYYLLGIHHKKTPLQSVSFFDKIKKINASKEINDLYCQALLEKAILYHQVSIQSERAKKEVYRQYAIRDLNQLTKEIRNNNEIYPALSQQGDLERAKIHFELGNSELAKEQLAEMDAKFQGASITRGYYLAKTHGERGQIAYLEGNYQRAINHFHRANDAAVGNLLSADEQLSLWIQESRCLRSVGNLKGAMLLLSRSVNEGVVSNLRLEAMYLRAEIYEEEKRWQLARRQLESLSQYGGIWAERAKQKLKREYSFD